jgi:hypothetical protein
MKNAQATPPIAIKILLECAADILHSTGELNARLDVELYPHKPLIRLFHPDPLHGSYPAQRAAVDRLAEVLGAMPQHEAIMGHSGYRLTTTSKGGLPIDTWAVKPIPLLAGKPAQRYATTNQVEQALLSITPWASTLDLTQVFKIIISEENAGVTVSLVLRGPQAIEVFSAK